jgi:predicted HicB family RNase H-like nuclease
MKFDDTLEFKGYRGSVEYSELDEVFHGKVLGIRSSVTYEGLTLAELEKGFREMLDFYLETNKGDKTDENA